MPRFHSLSDLSSLFGEPDAYARATKKDVQAEAQARPESHVMFDIADDNGDAKTTLSRPRKVTVSVQKSGRAASTLAQDVAGYRYVGRREMSVASWIAVRDNPRQRDTERHAKRAEHLRKPDPVHALVAMAELPDGSRFKLDGHTRALIWARGEAPAPDRVLVDLFQCESVDAVLALYSRYDAKVAVETAGDQVAGAAREAGLNFVTPMLKAGKYGAAVKRMFELTTRARPSSWAEADFTSAAVRHFADELLILDELNPQPRNFTSGIVMAFLATLRRRGRIGLPFWVEYSACRGLKAGAEMDAVQALHESVMAVKARKTRTGGQDQQMGLLSKGILAHNAYRDGYMYEVKRGIGNMGADQLKSYLRHGQGV